MNDGRTALDAAAGRVVVAASLRSEVPRHQIAQGRERQASKVRVVGGAGCGPVFGRARFELAARAARRRAAALAREQVGVEEP